jgi:alpha-glucosidase (family GH31 glycosyl hydrolase)
MIFKFFPIPSIFKKPKPPIFQLCRWGYENLTALQDAVARTMNAGIPFDVPFADIDYMDDYRDFSFDTNVACLE